MKKWLDHQAEKVRINNSKSNHLLAIKRVSSVMYMRTDYSVTSLEMIVAHQNALSANWGKSIWEYACGQNCHLEIL